MKFVHLCVVPWAAACFLAGGALTAHAQNALTANVQNAYIDGITTAPLELSAAAPVAGAFVPLSSSGMGTNPLVTYNWYPKQQLVHFSASLRAGTAKIVALGDSTTRGFCATNTGWTDVSYSAELAQFLTADGLTAQSDNFLGQGMYGSTYDTDLRVSFLGNAGWGPPAGGGSVIQTSNAGDGFNFTLNWPGNYNKVAISYIDVGSGSVSVAVDGKRPLATLQFGNTGNTLQQVVRVPGGVHTSLQLKQVGSSASYLQGASFFLRGSGIQVANAGIGGWTAASANTSYCNGVDVAASSCGFGATASITGIGATLVIVNLGINDLLQGGAPATIAANIAQIVSTLQQSKADVILVVPTPFADTSYAQMPALQADLEQVAVQAGVPLFDLSATYGNSAAALNGQGLMCADVIHPNATLYADIASAIASTLSAAVKTYAPGHGIRTAGN